MKYLINIMALLFLCSFQMQAQSKSVNGFYKKYKKEAKARNIKLNSFIIDISRSFMDEEASNILKKFSKVRLLVIEDSKIVNPTDLTQLMKSVKNEKFEDLINIRDGQSSVQILVRDSKKGITDLLLVVQDQEEDDFVLLSIQGLFKYEDLKDLDIDFNGKEHLDQLPDRV